jgi:hypothetical protein
LWFEQGLNGGDGSRCDQVMWFIMLRSTKDRILGVDTPGQHVLSCVRYGTTCLLIRNARLSRDGTILCDILCELPEPHGAREDVCVGNLSGASGDRLFGKP